MAAEGKISFFDDLLQKGHIQDIIEDRWGNEKISVLHLAAKHCRLKICQILVNDYKMDINLLTKKRLTPLHYLVSHNNIRETIQFEKIGTEKRHRSQSYSVCDLNRMLFFQSD